MVIRNRVCNNRVFSNFNNRIRFNLLLGAGHEQRDMHNWGAKKDDVFLDSRDNWFNINRNRSIYNERCRDETKN